MPRLLNKVDRKNGERLMVVRVTKTEFELSDGRVFPMMFDFADDEVPTVEEFQQSYDQWRSLFGELKLTGEHEQATGEHK
jgi:hypothetical protein